MVVHDGAVLAAWGDVEPVPVSFHAEELFEALCTELTWTKAHFGAMRHSANWISTKPPLTEKERAACVIYRGRPAEKRLSTFDVATVSRRLGTGCNASHTLIRPGLPQRGGRSQDPLVPARIRASCAERT